MHSTLAVTWLLDPGHDNIYLPDAFGQTAAILALAWFFSALLRRSSAAKRHAFWLGAVFIALLLPLLWHARLREWRVSWMPPLGVGGMLYGQTDGNHLPLSMGEVAETGPGQPLPQLSDFHARPIPGRFEPVSAASRQGPEFDDVVLEGIIYLWLPGVGVLLLPVLVGWVQVARLTRRGRMPSASIWKKLMAEAACQIGVRPARLLAAPGVTTPLTWGVWRPVVLIPEEADAWPETQQRLMLLHELGHIKRADWLTLTFGAVARALHWFNPLAWLAARRLRIECERACDDLVLRCGQAPKDYANALVAIAEGSLRMRLLGWAVVPMTRPSTLETRLHAILDGRSDRTTMPRAALAIVLVLAGTASVVLTKLRALSAPIDFVEQPWSLHVHVRPKISQMGGPTVWQPLPGGGSVGSGEDIEVGH